MFLLGKTCTHPPPKQPSTRVHSHTLPRGTDTHVSLRTAVRHGGLSPCGAEDVAANTRGHANTRANTPASEHGAGTGVPRGGARFPNHVNKHTRPDVHDHSCTG